MRALHAARSIRKKGFPRTIIIFHIDRQTVSMQTSFHLVVFIPIYQVIVGEHEELPETELNEGSMILDPEVENLLENGNMEQLAALVLNGEGRRLVGRQSNNPELQAFIDNVPAYMVNKSTIELF